MPDCASVSGCALPPIDCPSVPNGFGVVTTLSSWSVVEAVNVWSVAPLTACVSGKLVTVVLSVGDAWYGAVDEVT